MTNDEAVPVGIDAEYDAPINLKNGLDVAALQAGYGQEFETEEDEKYDEYLYDPSINSGPREDNNLPEVDLNELTDFEALALKMEDVTSDGGVKKQVLTPGVGPVVPKEAHVIVHYNIFLEFSDEPYDSSRLRGKPSNFDLGKGAVLPGFDIAVASMRKKETSKFLIRPEYGMGKHGCPPRVPGGATCMYYIELINYIDAGGASEYYNMPRSERSSASMELILKVVKVKRSEGMQSFNTKGYPQAAKAYAEAIHVLEDYHLKDEPEEQRQQKELLGLYLNLAVCSLKLCQSERAIKNASLALKIDPNSAKALYCKGKALRQLGEFERAKRELFNAQKLLPTSREITKELEDLQMKFNNFQMMEKNMCQKMFSTNQPGKTTGGSDSAAVCSDFKTLIADKLNLFVKDNALFEIPYSSNDFTLNELGCIESTAKKMCLLVIRKVQDNVTHIRICKKKTEDET